MSNVTFAKKIINTEMKVKVKIQFLVRCEMKVYIIVHDSVYDKSSDFIDICGFYAFSTEKIAKKYWQQIGSDRFSYSIKSLELLEE